MSDLLRPLKLGEILDRTAQLYRRNFLLFAGVAAIPTGAMLLAALPVGAVIAIFGLLTVKSGGTPNLGTIALIAGIVLIFAPVAVAVTVLSQAAVTGASISTYMGRKLTIRAALRSVWPRFWTFFGLLLLQGIFAALIPGVIAAAVIGVLAYFVSQNAGNVATAEALGFLMFVVSAAAFVYIVWRALGYAMSMAACIGEEKLAWDSLQRSVVLSKGARGRIFVMFLLVWALSIIISIIGYIPTTILMALATTIGHGAQSAAFVIVGAEVLNVLVNFTLQTLITPVYIIALVLLYYDQRVRLEGYDIDRMMEQAGLSGGRLDQNSAQIGTTSAPAIGPATVKES
jgi:hypothetical protein